MDQHGAAADLHFQYTVGLRHEISPCGPVRVRSTRPVSTAHQTGDVSRVIWESAMLCEVVVFCRRLFVCLSVCPRKETWKLPIRK